MKRFHSIMLLASATVVLSSCLKDKDIEDRKYGMEGVEDIQLVEITDAPSKAFALNYVDVDTTFVLAKVHLNTATPASEDIKITLTKNDALVAAYNASHGTGYEVPPASIYTLGNLEVTIPKGSRDGEITIKTNPAKLSAAEYALGLSITAASNSSLTLSKNYKDIVVYIGVKNKYDGVYRMKGFHNRAPYTFPYDVTMHMVTLSPKTVIFYWPEMKSVGHPIGIAPGETNWYGASMAPVVQFDPATDIITNVYNNPPNTTVINIYTGAGSGTGRYDAANKKMYVYWQYSNNPQRAFLDTLTFISQRP